MYFTTVTRKTKQSHRLVLDAIRPHGARRLLGNRDDKLLSTTLHRNFLPTTCLREVRWKLHMNIALKINYSEFLVSNNSAKSCEPEDLRTALNLMIKEITFPTVPFGWQSGFLFPSFFSFFNFRVFFTVSLPFDKNKNNRSKFKIQNSNFTLTMYALTHYDTVQNCFYDQFFSFYDQFFKIRCKR